MLTPQNQPTDAALQVLGQDILDRVLRSPSLHNLTSYKLLDSWALEDPDHLRTLARHTASLAIYLSNKTREVKAALDSPEAMDKRQSGMTDYEILKELGIHTRIPAKIF